MERLVADGRLGRKAKKGFYRYDESGKKLVLGPNDHLATGGEGAVYARGGTVFKVYLDADKARAARMGDKLALLKQLRHPGRPPNGRPRWFLQSIGHVASGWH